MLQSTLYIPAPWVLCLKANIIGIPAIGFSINNLDENADLESAKDIVRFVLQKYYDGEYDSYYADTFSDVPVCLNVNIPDGDVKGVMLCNQARGKWSEDFELRKNADGEDEYWLVGEFHNLDKDRTDTDHMRWKTTTCRSFPSQLI